MMPGIEAVAEQRDGAEEEGGQRSQRDLEPVVAIGDVASKQRHPDERYRFCQTDEAEGERIPGEIVDLPGHDHRLNLRGDSHGHETGDEAAEIRDPQCFVGIVTGLAHRARKLTAERTWSQHCVLQGEMFFAGSRRPSPPRLNL